MTSKADSFISATSGVKTVTLDHSWMTPNSVVYTIGHSDNDIAKKEHVNSA